MKLVSGLFETNSLMSVSFQQIVDLDMMVLFSKSSPIIKDFEVKEFSFDIKLRQQKLIILLKFFTVKFSGLNFFKLQIYSRPIP